MSVRAIIVFGTRPEVIKLAPLIHAIQNSELTDSIATVCTAQHKDLLQAQLDFWNIKPDFFLEACPYKDNLSQLLAHTLNGLATLISKLKTVEYVIVQGDTNTALACANLCFLNKLKLIHIEAGLRSFDFDCPFPEEYNRVIASRVAYFHFAPTEISKQNLLKEGVGASSIMVTGNTVIDALEQIRNKIPGGEPAGKTTVIITLHRRENLQANCKELVETVNYLAGRHTRLNFVWVTHPNCEQQVTNNLQYTANIELRKPMPYGDFIKLYHSTAVVITDSGGIIEEATQMGIPVVVFRKITERVEPLIQNYPVLVSVNREEIISGFNKFVHQPHSGTFTYGSGNASQQILRWLQTELSTEPFDLVVVGGGPAGTGIFFKALKDGIFSKLSGVRIALVEKSNHLLTGSLPHYRVNSDTSADVFLEMLEGEMSTYIDLGAIKSEIEGIEKRKGQSLPLNDLNLYLTRLGALLENKLEESQACSLLFNTTVEAIHQTNDGFFQIHLGGGRRPLIGRKVIVAAGGTPTSRLQTANKLSIATFADKTVHSDSLLKNGITEDLKEKLKSNSRVVILGGSHSAFSAAHLLLNTANLHFKPGAIKIWANKRPKIFFASRKDAEHAGYSDFTNADFCPVTQRLYRLAGLRMDGRQLYLQMLGLAGNEPECRVTLNTFKEDTAIPEKDLEDAGLIIAALGYRFNMPALYNTCGEPVIPAGTQNGRWVNNRCQVLDSTGIPVSNLYATGLASGFVPSGNMGGEPGFEGQTNGLWYYQNVIADIILKNLLNESSSVVS